MWTWAYIESLDLLEICLLVEKRFSANKIVITTSIGTELVREMTIAIDLRGIHQMQSTIDLNGNLTGKQWVYESRNLRR